MTYLKLETVLNERDTLPRKQKALCDYIADNINEAEVLTVKQLAEKAGVGDATVFRFLKEAGYASYAEFREELHRYAVEFTRSSYWQMKASLQKKADIPEEHSLYRAASLAINLIGKTMTPKLLNNFDAAVELILASSQVGIFGLRSSKAVALYFYYLMLPLLPSIRQFSHDEHYIFEQISQMPEGSTMLIVTSWPNTQTTIDAANFCHQMGHKVILLANSLSCPIASYADLLLVTPEAEDQYTILPYITVLEALANEIALRQKPQSIRQLTHMDEVLAENRVTNWIREKRP